MTPNPELRAKALAALRGKWVPAISTSLVFLALTQGIYLILSDLITSETTSLLTGIEKTYETLKIEWSLSSILLLISIPLGFGYFIIFLNLMRSGKEPKINALLDGFKNYGKVFGTMLLAYIFMVLWMLLLIIPGIIKSYSYAMVPYLIKDEPELGANETIEKSMAMMDGNKTKLFLLDLSFLGWSILAVLPIIIAGTWIDTLYTPIFGIGVLWLYPYYYSARAAFYEDLKNAQHAQIIEA